MSLRVLTFLRLPCCETEEALHDHVWKVGGRLLEVHQGPDGRWRGTALLADSGAVPAAEMAEADTLPILVTP